MDNALQVNVVCRLCEESQIVTVPREGYLRFQKGIAIQSAMPEIPADQRELLISGVCPACWKELETESEGDEEDFIEDDVADAKELGLEPREMGEEDPT